jgi:hypothetical protein
MKQFKEKKMSKVGEHYREKEEMLDPEEIIGPNEGLRPEDDPISNCCGMLFTYPGWPDSDTCSECGEHADLYDEMDE